jgi:hypothetical protein
VRAAAVDDFLASLKAHGSADLNEVMTTLNDAALCRETLEHWKEKGWVSVARAMPLVALRGEAFSRDLTLRRFCGEPEPEPAPGLLAETAEAQTKEQQHDGDS